MTTVWIVIAIWLGVTAFCGVLLGVVLLVDWLRGRPVLFIADDPYDGPPKPPLQVIKGGKADGRI